LRTTCGRHDEKIAPAYQRFQVALISVLHITECAQIVVRDQHTEGHRAVCDRAADASHAENPQLFAADLMGERQVLSFFPASCPNVPITNAELSRCREHERNCEIRNIVGQYVGRCRNAYFSLARML